MRHRIARARRHRGLSLVEALLATLVLQVAVLAVGFALAAGQDQAARGRDAIGGVALAEDLLERVLGLPFADPDGPSELGPEPGETPATFDNTDDYHGYADEAEGPTPGLGAFRRSVRIVPGAATPAGLGAPVPGLTVTVTAEQGAGRWSIARFVPEGAP